MSINFKQATYESLLSTYFYQTSAAASAERLDALIQANQRYTLDNLLRDHRIDGQGVTEGPESEDRAAADQFLKSCSALEIASQAGVIPPHINAELASLIKRILGDPSVRKYYEAIYPECNPQLFLLRLLGKETPEPKAEDYQCWSYFNRFIELDLRFVHDIESGPNALFLRLLDGWSLPYKGISYDFDSIIKIIASPEDFVSILIDPVDSSDPRSSGVHGFAAFLAFVTDLDLLLSDLAEYPMLQSCIWHHYGYWFRVISENIGDGMGKAINGFLAWKPPARFQHEKIAQPPDDLIELVGQIKSFVQSKINILYRIIDPALRMPVELVLQQNVNPQNFPIRGPKLLARVKRLGAVSKSDLVRSCGYVTTKKDGTERLNFTAFYEALLEAKGLSFGEGGKGRGKAGRSLSYVTKIQLNGNLMVGKAYTAQLGLQPGDEFEIRIGGKHITLVPIRIRGRYSVAESTAIGDLLLRPRSHAAYHRLKKEEVAFG